MACPATSRPLPSRSRTRSRSRSRSPSPTGELAMASGDARSRGGRGPGEPYAPYREVSRSACSPAGSRGHRAGRGAWGGLAARRDGPSLAGTRIQPHRPGACSLRRRAVRRVAGPDVDRGPGRPRAHRVDGRTRGVRGGPRGPPHRCLHGGLEPGRPRLRVIARVARATRSPTPGPPARRSSPSPRALRTPKNGSTQQGHTPRRTDGPPRPSPAPGAACTRGKGSWKPRRTRMRGSAPSSSVRTRSSSWPRSLGAASGRLRLPRRARPGTP